MCYLSRGMDPDGRVEQNVVTQLLEQQDPILQVAKVSGKGQYNVQDRPRHMHLGRLAQREGDKKAQSDTNGGEGGKKIHRKYNSKETAK